MKKFLLIAIIGLIAGTVSAQVIYVPRKVVRRRPPVQRVDDFYKVRLGITGGVSIANAVNAYNTYNSTGTIAGFNAGLTLDIPIAYPFIFAPEVLYSQKGFIAATDYGSFTQRNNYIDVPLLAKFHLAPNFNFLIGPQVSFPISTTQTYDTGFTSAEQQQYNTTNDKTILDGVIGVSFDLSSNVELRARYTIDLQPNDENTTLNGDYRNQVWQIGLGIKFE